MYVDSGIEYVLLTDAARSAETLRRATVAQGSRLVALDSAFTGNLVCGSERLDALRRDSEVELPQLTTSDAVYTFGAGRLGASASYGVSIQGERFDGCLDVVEGPLPLLAAQVCLGRSRVGLDHSPTGVTVTR